MLTVKITTEKRKKRKKKEKNAQRIKKGVSLECNKDGTSLAKL